MAVDTSKLLDTLNRDSVAMSRDETDADPSIWRSFTSASLSKFKLTGMKLLNLKRQSQLDIKMDKSMKAGDLLMVNKKQEEEQEEEDESESMKICCTSDSVASFHDLSTEVIQDVCYSVVKLFHSTKSIQTEQNNKLMFIYIQQVFDSIDENTIDSFVKRASAEKCLLTLKCNVIKANGLLAKDANGKSDPYCILCMLNKDQIDTKLVRNHNMGEWLENKIISGVQKTSVKQETLDPIWNETFELAVTNPREQYLVIELWDSDDEQKMKVKGFKGFGRMLADLKGEDDFLGRVFFLLQHVPFGGGEKTLELLSHSTKHSRGTITIWMDLVGQSEVMSEEDHHLTYKRVLQCIAAHESKKDGVHMRRWEGKISETGEKLLSQCASLHCITPLQQSAIWLSILLDYNKAYAIDVRAFSTVLGLIQERSGSLKAGTPPFWVDQLSKDLKELSTYIMDIMKQHLDIFNNFKSEESIRLLKDHILVLHDLYQIRLYKAQLSNQQLDIKVVLNNAIQVAVPHWMLVMAASFMPAYSSSEQNVIAFKGLCTHCLRQCQRSYEKVHPVFQEVGVDYFSPFYMSLDKLLHSEAESRLGKGNSETALYTYETYRIIQDINKFADKVDPKLLKSSKLSIVNFHFWFKGCVTDWIGLVQSKAKQRLKTSIELDKIVKISERAMFSSSAVDTHAFFLQVISFWKDLQWPDRAQSIGYFTIVVQSLVDMSAYYAEQIFTKVNPEDYTDAKGRFIVTDKLCITLNNIQHVKNVLGDIRSELDLPAYYKWLDEDKQEGGLPLSQRAETLFTEVIESAKEDLYNKINVIIDIVQKRLFPTIIEFISNMMLAAIDVPHEKVLEPMLNFITENLGKLGQSLLTPIFLGILQNLWVRVISALRKEYNKVPHTSQNPLLIRLNYLVLNLSDFFEAGGGGLSRSEIESEEYTSLRDDLFYGVLSTDDIMRKFCYDLVKQQVYSKQTIGTLHMSHIYDPAKKALVVDIVSAENIPALDHTGKSDPYIQLFLLPTNSFVAASHKSFKTSIQKQTLNPLFNETFTLPAEEAELKKDGAVLLMAVFDHDLLSSDDFAGLCIIPCNSTKFKGKERKIEHLNLFHYKETRAFEELERRSAEKEANKFLKFIKMFVYEGEAPAGHPFHKFRESLRRIK